MAKRALDASENAAANEKETPGRGGKMMYDDERNVICGTIVTSFRESWPAPRKRVRHIGRIQMPPASALMQEWSLDAGGAWGYKFNYKANEVCFYQLEKGETFGSLVAQATLTLIDWSVLNMPSQGFPPNPPPSTPTTPDSSDSDGSISRPAPAAADVQTGPPCKGMHDETDSVLSAAFLNTVRAVVSKLLLYVLDRYRKEICNGCQINHPSQCQHECLEETPDYFYEVDHSQLMERLWTGRFIPTIQRALNARRLCVSEYRVRGACDFLLHDFKTMRRIEHSIAKIYNTMTKGDEEKIEIVDQNLEFWLIE
ncbi:hypothetical protein ABVT39_001785 [Epinephelus coioides]